MPESVFNDDVVNNFNKKETLTQVFSCEFREIFNNAFFAEHLRATAFVIFLWYWNATIWAS